MQRAADKALSDYVAARARAAGFDEQGVAAILHWLPRRVPDSPLLITSSRVEMELQGGVQVRIRRFICPDYAPASGSIRCRSFVDGGGCGRPEHPICVEWQRANPR